MLDHSSRQYAAVRRNFTSLSHACLIQMAAGSSLGNQFVDLAVMNALLRLFESDRLIPFGVQSLVERLLVTTSTSVIRRIRRNSGTSV